MSKEFIINNKTNIYIKERLFQQCKFLLLNVPTEDVNPLYGKIKTYSLTL